ncbi:MAG: NifB/NifX family molybdenum-iron cluster-binding protein [Thermoleophilia bacterium]|nr:NifB/NifX family molybdenum-iron cluster-binding protein [Thermoleophilia bacterium]
MKIVLSMSEPELGAPLDRGFGKAPYLVVYDDQTKEWESFPNPGAGSELDSGTEAAELARDQGAALVITGAMGPNALNVLKTCKIEVRYAQGGTGSSALEAWRRGELPLAEEASRPGRS